MRLSLLVACWPCLAVWAITEKSANIFVVFYCHLSHAIIGRRKHKFELSIVLFVFLLALLGNLSLSFSVIYPLIYFHYAIRSKVVLYWFWPQRTNKHTTKNIRWESQVRHYLTILCFLRVLCSWSSSSSKVTTLSCWGEQKDFVTIGHHCCAIIIHSKQLTGLWLSLCLCECLRGFQAEVSGGRREDEMRYLMASLFAQYTKRSRSLARSSCNDLSPIYYFKAVCVCVWYII